MLLLLVQLGLASCGGGGSSESLPTDSSNNFEFTPTSDNGTVFIALTDADGDFASYIVDVMSISLAHSDGTVTEILPAKSRIDFTQYTDTKDLVASANLKEGGYTHASIRLDYTQADIRVVAGDTTVALTPKDVSGNLLGILNFRVDFDKKNPLKVEISTPVALTLDYDLDSSNSVDLTTDSVTVSPKLTAEITQAQSEGYRARGVLGSVDPSTNSLTLNIRPLHYTHGNFGSLDVKTDSDTRYEINYTPHLGNTGLAQLSSTASRTEIIVLGAIDTSTHSFHAQHIFAGLSVPSSATDVVTGTVVARDNSVLTLRGAIVERSGTGPDYNEFSTVILGTNTLVIRYPGETANIDDISVGQRISAYGHLTENNASSIPTLDTSNSLIRIEPGRATGIVTEASPDSFAVSLATINGRPLSIFNFDHSELETGSGTQNTYRVLTGSPGISSPHINESVDLYGTLDSAKGTFPLDRPLSTNGIVEPLSITVGTKVISGTALHQTTNLPVEIRASTDSADSIEYQFWTWAPNAVAPILQQDWGPETFTWETTGLTEGRYVVQTRARRKGSKETFEAIAQLGLQLNQLRFEEVTESAGFNRTGESWGGAWGDANSDGLPDLWATNHRTKPALYINNGNGTFTNRIDEYWGKQPHTDAHGTAWADFDNDGDQDLIQVAGGGQGIRNVVPGQFNHLYVNSSNTLTDKAVQLGVSYPPARGRGATWLDWNTDGRLDLFFTVLSGGSDPPNALFIQQTDGSFVDGSGLIGISTKDTGSFALQTRSDINHTNTLLTGNVNKFPQSKYPGSSSSLATLPNLSTVFSVWDSAIADFTGDLIPDIYLARSALERQLYTLKSATRLDFILGTFQRSREVGLGIDAGKQISIELNVPGQRLAGVYIGSKGLSPEKFDFSPVHSDDRFRILLSADDPDTWGMLDRSTVPYGVFIGFSQQTQIWTILTYNDTSSYALSTVFGSLTTGNTINSVEEINFEAPLINPPDRLLAGTENGKFVIKPNSDMGRGTASKSVVAGDFDNDMDIDLYVLESTRIGNLPNALYINQGDGMFNRLPGAAGAEGTLLGTGDTAIVADYDVDGFLDIATFNGRGEPPFNDGPQQLFRNAGNNNNWLEIDLVGTQSNRDGIGALIYATTPDSKTQVREQNGQIHSKGQNSKRIHFGLGRNQQASITVKWPSGISQDVGPVAANQVIRIEEKAP